jgi:cell division protease FtsH
MKIKSLFLFVTNIFFVNSLDINHVKYNYNILERYVSGKIPYKSLINKINDHSVSKIYFSKGLDNVISEDNNELYSLTSITPVITNDLVDISVKNDVDTVFFEVPPKNIVETVSSEIGGFLESAFMPVIVLSFLISFIRSFLTIRRMNNSMNKPNNSPLNGPMPMNLPFNSPFSSIMNNNGMNTKKILKKMNISLSSFAGSPEIFEECTEVVSYLKNATLYQMAGAEIPKGILLDGPPGTGKTLLAKAIASEADANFIAISASEFVEVFVGVGALKIRNLFDNARQNIPSIIFIDEIDSIGRQRGAGINMGNDEREQTLNQLLAEMDGFQNNNGVLVIAATNRKDVLDSALLRPGRFDRIITVPLPDRESRKEIIKVHSKNKNLDSSINLDLVSELTSGFSGAQIKNLLNEAAIYAARNSRTVITQLDILNAIDKLIVGLVRKTDTRSSDSIKRVAIHETGHALLCKTFNEYFDLKKVSIQSTYNGAGGYTLFSEYQNITDSGLYTKDLLKKRLIIALGGKAAEYIYYGADHVSVGAVQDLKQANSIAQQMVGNYGMGDYLEVFYNENVDSSRNPFLGKSIGLGIKYSDKTKETFDRESLNLVIEAYEEAKSILLKNKDNMDIIINKLLEKSVLYGGEI